MTSSTFTLLDDQPYGPSEQDPLGFDQIAENLAALIRASRASTPLALGIESGWGMGKSTLMRRVQAVLKTDADIETVWFNACGRSGRSGRRRRRARVASTVP